MENLYLIQSAKLISLCYSCDMSLLIRFKCIRFYWNDTIINVSVPSANSNPFTPPQRVSVR